MTRVEVAGVVGALLTAAGCGSPSTATVAEAQAALLGVSEGWVDILWDYRAGREDLAAGDQHPASCARGEGTVAIDAVSDAQLTVTLTLDDCVLGGSDVAESPRWSGSAVATVPRTSPFSYEARGGLTVRAGEVEFQVTRMALAIHALDGGFYCWEATAVVDTGEVALATSPAGLAACTDPG